MTTAGGHGARQAWLVATAAAILWFALLGYRDLVDPDEGRYAEIPREMLASGDWVTPRLDGVKYFEKPPLQYWATAATFAVAGEGNATARFWVALAGGFGALFTAWLGLRLFGPDVGRLAGLISVSGLLYVAMGHVLTLDMTLTLFMTLAMGCLALAQTQRDRPGAVRTWMLFAWAALGGAVLTKGLVALVLAGGAVTVYLLWQRDWPMLRHLHLTSGLLLLLALTAPWFVAVSRANPEFAHFFFVHEHWERFTTDVHGREGPIYYFAGVLLLGAMPWTRVVLDALMRPRLQPTGGQGFQPERLFWVYIAFVLVFFSISHSKLPAYILPVWPFAALLAARRAVSLTSLRKEAWAPLTLAVLLLVLSLLAPRFASETTPPSLLEAYRPWVLASSAGFAAAALLLWFGFRSIVATTAAVALIALLSMKLLDWGAQSLAPSRSGRALANAIEALDLPNDTPVYFVGHYSPSLAFYLGRLPRLVDYRGELAFGADAEPGRILDAGSFAQRWQQERRAVAVVASRRDRYLAMGLPMQVVERGPRRTLLVRAPPELATQEQRP